MGADTAEVTTSTQRRRPGIVVHVRRTVAAERDVRLGIPVTSLARTIVDLAHTLEADGLERVVREADFQRRLDVDAVRASLVRRPSHALSDLLERRSPTQSRHDDRFLRLCLQFGLPAPLTQQRVGPRTVDFLGLMRDLLSRSTAGTHTAPARHSRTTGPHRTGCSSLATSCSASPTTSSKRGACVARLVRRALAAQLTLPPVR